MCPTIILFLGLLLWMRWSAIGQCFSLSPVAVGEVFVNLNLDQSPISFLKWRIKGACFFQLLVLCLPQAG